VLYCVFYVGFLRGCLGHVGCSPLGGSRLGLWSGACVWFYMVFSFVLWFFVCSFWASLLVYVGGYRLGLLVDGSCGVALWGCTFGVLWGLCFCGYVGGSLLCALWGSCWVALLG